MSFIKFIKGCVLKNYYRDEPILTTIFTFRGNRHSIDQVIYEDEKETTPYLGGDLNLNQAIKLRDWLTKCIEENNTRCDSC